MNFTSQYAVAYLLKAKTVEPEKQPLLANGSETTFRFLATAAKQTRERLCKHVRAATDTKMKALCARAVPRS
jgi:hypothetical protein